MHGASPGFDMWLDDLVQIIDWTAARAAGPLVAVAHSMGAHLVLRHLAAGKPGLDRAAVLAPMTGLAAAPFGPTIARWLARLMVKRGHGSDYVLGGGPWEPGLPGSARQTLLTSDAERYADESWWIGQYPALALGSVTWGWLDDAFASIAVLSARGVPEAIRVPVLALIPEKDGLVDSQATRRLIGRMPNGALTAYPDAGHELLRERDGIRAAVMERLLAFLG
jgi:lysophospholipase